MHHSHHWHRHGWQRGIGFLVLIVAGVAAFSWIVMQLWNAVLPDVFGWKTITYFQALGLLVLSKIFFGGWHRGGHHGCHHRRHDGWANLSDEEREKLRSKFRHGWCGMHDKHGSDINVSDAKPGGDAA